MTLTPFGSEFRVNSYTTNDQRTFFQSPQSVAMDSDGDFVVTWNSYGQDGSRWGIYAQRYNAAGVAQGNEFRVNSFTGNNQQYSAVAMDASGNFVVTWSSNSSSSSPTASDWGVFAQRYNAAGVAQGTEFRVNSYTPNNQIYSTVAMDATGDFVVTWNSNGQDGLGYGVYAQRYNAAGVAQGNEFRVNTTTIGNQMYSTVAMDTEGDFVVSWSSLGQDSSGYGVYAQRYNAAGVAQGTEFRVNSYTSSNQMYSKVAIDTDGDFVISWSSNGQDGTGWGVYAQRYNAVGVAQGSEFQVNTTTSNNQLYSTVAMDTDGDFVISWSSNAQDGSGYGVYAQRYNAAGVAQGNEFQVNTTTSNHQQFSAVAMNTRGDFAVVWNSNSQDGSGSGMYAQLYQINSAPITTGISNVTVLEDAPNTVINLFSAFSDDNDTNSQLTYTIANNSNSNLFSGTTIDPITGQLLLSYVPNANGASNMTIRATDTQGLFVETSFGVTVTPVNDSPIVASAIAPQTATEDSPFTFQFAADTFSDVDTGDILTYSATLSNNSLLPSWLSFNAATRTFTGTPINENVGTLAISVTATDSAGASVSNSFNLAIANTNDAPTVTRAIAPQTATEDSPFTFQFAADTFSDVDTGDILTYSATLSNNSPLPSWLSFNAATRTFSGTPLGENVTNLSLKVTTTDQAGASTFTPIALTINPLNIEGTSAADVLIGTASNNIIDGKMGADFIDGQAGNDTLIGAWGVDEINGGSGNDLIVGGWGWDQITGGAGSDRFVYNDFSEVGDFITDFGNGNDVIDMTALFDNLGYSGIDPIGDGYLQFIQRGENAQIQIAPDGQIGDLGFTTAVHLNNFSIDNLTIGSNILI